MTTDNAQKIDALQSALTEEREARERAEAELHEKTEALAVLAHEVKTPIGAFMSVCELLGNSRLDATQKQYVSTLQKSATSLLAVVNDVLSTAKDEANKVEVHADQFDLLQFIEEFAYQTKLDAAHHKLGFHLEVDPSCPKLVNSDPGRLRQMLTNYVNNALKFTDTGSITLKVRAEQAISGEALVRFEVHDTGIGIASADRSRLFSAYEQVPTRDGREAEGTGLGLHIVRQLSASMGGDCGCASVEGEGSVFWFTIALDASSASTLEDSDEEDTAAEEHEDADASTGLRGHVLLVDDNDINRMIVCTYLEQFGLSYDAAASGSEALNFMRTGRYDVILMDVMMPGQDGVETTKQARKMGLQASSVPIIALTARASEAEKTEYYYAGMTDCLGKPISAEALYAMLEKHLVASGAARTGTNG